ncbi:MAG TPA: hypothetical protein DDW76_10275 [Cyanobacteria bacterium UBA11369]|nr:hypothetical protein [Cyanobacteria bacterium UBA11371]HBE17333.1 hypothetical protein [Cyanobacteria bacterium UBA11367]HBE30542.1 hypothetical protein [Cyanobacteria bacterium UBA11368]HBE49159.1 hypothetical protein [Cyanobacteria bacterium UBA11369]
MNRDALVVGINQYPFLKDTPTSKAKHLSTPASDAEAIAQRLEEYGGFRVRRLPETIQEGQRRVAAGTLVQTDALEDAIIRLFNPVGESVPETALLYFGGHGLRKNRGGVTEGFLATSDTCPQKNQWGVSLRWLRELLQKSPVRQQIVWLDCCYSGELLNFAEADLGTTGQESLKHTKQVSPPLNSHHYLATASADKTARLWEVSNSKQIACMRHEGHVYSIAFTPDSQYLATASADKTARIWEVPSGREISRITHNNDVKTVVFSSDGKYLATTSNDGTVKVWLWKSEDLIDEACNCLTRNLTPEEWQQYLDREPYRKTCSNLD